MDELLTRISADLAGRIGGPLTFRLVLQPIMACLFAIRDGRDDALQGRPPYFWALFTQPTQRGEMLREGWKAVSKVFVIAVAIDVIYQVVVLRWVYPGEALFVALLLAFLPYLLVRGPVNRLLAAKPGPVRKTV